jgi:Cu2+-exporting ATPase
MADQPTPCFHCGEPCPPGLQIIVERDGSRLPMCCHGCKAVSELILASGLDRYYEFRTSEGRKADDDLARSGQVWRACDSRPELWGEETAQGRRDLLLQTEGVECAACAWLIRSRLEPQAGIERVQVDVGSGNTRVVWEPAQTTLSHIALELSRLGYRPHLPIGEEEERGRLQERRSAMLRVGVAGLGMMQVMMYAVGLYAGDALGITPGARRFLAWTSLLVTIPVVFYSGRPFFDSAIASLRARRVNMDVPVALAVGIAFIASTANFLRGEGAVYFDSVVMFVFFLSSARYVQLAQRHRNLQGGAALARLLPEWARRIHGDSTETVLASDLAVGDRVRVPAGEPFPADATVLEGTTQVDEALLTGESYPHSRGPGDKVVGGSINLSQPVDVAVTAVGRDLTVSALGRLLLRAGGQRSRFISQSERIAAWFVVAVLVIALLTGIGWSYFQPSGALSAVLAVLVVSCPCALSLAAPAAMSAAGRKLLRHGVLMTRGDALEALPRVKIAVFDKTGTLTEGEPVISAIHLNPERADIGEKRALAIAAGLEAHSAHPLARAFRGVASASGLTDVESVSHGGVSGLLEGNRWFIGSAAYTGTADSETNGQDGRVWLADENEWIAGFEIQDELRRDAEETLALLHMSGIRTVIASGDSEVAVSRVARRLGVDEWHARQDPASKMERVRDWQKQGARVLMVGDGVNDAPVLACADVSMTVPGATDLANSAADFILTAESLGGISEVMEVARCARGVIRQNFTWAIAYNFAALPLAIGGILEPWMAALGMSLSSLLVVANSARLGRSTRRDAARSRTITGAVPA